MGKHLPIIHVESRPGSRNTLLHSCIVIVLAVGRSGKLLKEGGITFLENQPILYPWNSFFFASVSSGKLTPMVFTVKDGGIIKPDEFLLAKEIVRSYYLEQRGWWIIGRDKRRDECFLCGTPDQWKSATGYQKVKDIIKRFGGGLGSVESYFTKEMPETLRILVHDTGEVEDGFGYMAMDTWMSIREKLSVDNHSWQWRIIQSEPGEELLVKGLFARNDKRAKEIIAQLGYNGPPVHLVASASTIKNLPGGRKPVLGEVIEVTRKTPEHSRIGNVFCANVNTHRPNSGKVNVGVLNTNPEALAKFTLMTKAASRLDEYGQYAKDACRGNVDAILNVLTNGSGMGSSLKAGMESQLTRLLFSLPHFTDRNHFTEWLIPRTESNFRDLSLYIYNFIFQNIRKFRLEGKYAGYELEMEILYNAPSQIMEDLEKELGKPVVRQHGPDAVELSPARVKSCLKDFDGDMCVVTKLIKGGNVHEVMCVQMPTLSIASFTVAKPSGKKEDEMTHLLPENPKVWEFPEPVAEPEPAMSENEVYMQRVKFIAASAALVGMLSLELRRTHITRLVARQPMSEQHAVILHRLVEEIAIKGMKTRASSADVSISDQVKWFKAVCEGREPLPAHYGSQKIPAVVLTAEQLPEAEAIWNLCDKNGGVKIIADEFEDFVNSEVTNIAVLNGWMAAAKTLVNMGSEVAEHYIPQFVGWKHLAGATEISARTGIIDESDCERLRKIFVRLREQHFPRQYGKERGWVVFNGFQAVVPEEYKHHMLLLEQFDAHAQAKADQIVKFYNTVAAYSRLAYPEVEAWVQETLVEIESNPIKRKLQANNLAMRIHEYCLKVAALPGVKADECPSILKISDKKLRNEAFRAISIRLKVMTAEWIVGARATASYLWGAENADLVSECWLGIHLGAKAFGFTKGGKPRRGAQFSMAISPEAKRVIAQKFHGVLNKAYHDYPGYKPCAIMDSETLSQVITNMKESSDDRFGDDWVDDAVYDDFDIADLPDFD